MKITAELEARAIAAIGHDVEVTVGSAHLHRVRQEAARRRSFFNDPGSITVDAMGFFVDIAESIQQEFHDGFIDTTWPACPFHRQHPLWLHDGNWVCERSREPVARLGELRASRDSAGGYLILTKG
jgi:hypothetical protein